MLAAARAARNNWQKWKNVVWWKTERMEGKFLWEMCNEHSPLVDLSNFNEIARRLRSVDPEGHHWEESETSCDRATARKGFLILPLERYHESLVTPAWKVVYDARAEIERVKVLDPQELARMESSVLLGWVYGTLCQLRGAGSYEPNIESAERVIAWLKDHAPRELDNNDGHGATPSKEIIKQALDAIEVT
jgi:hypothetical protein